MSSLNSATAFPMPDRRLQWVSSVDPRNVDALQDLALRMQRYYATTAVYYDDISFGESAWITDPQYGAILEILRGATSILEVGCGRAGVLKFLPSKTNHYTGIDFSIDLIQQNRQRYSNAGFEVIEDSTRFPVSSSAYDVVFSVYVIEHTVFPTAFLDECYRAVKPGGRIIIYCPNFLGRGWLSSQRVGFGQGGATRKLRRGAYIDGLVSGFDRAIRIPWRSLQLRMLAHRGRGFYVNLAPVCFCDPFFPDADATYLTYAPEMLQHLGDRVTMETSSMVNNSDYRYFLKMLKR